MRSTAQVMEPSSSILPPVQTGQEYRITRRGQGRHETGQTYYRPDGPARQTSLSQQAEAPGFSRPRSNLDHEFCCPARPGLCRGSNQKRNPEINKNRKSCNRRKKSRMKRFLAGVMLAFAGTIISGAEPPVIVDNGKPAAEIVVGEKAARPEKFAAKELQLWIKTVTGATLEITAKPKLETKNFHRQEICRTQLCRRHKKTRENRRFRDSDERRQYLHFRQYSERHSQWSIRIP